MLYEHRTVSTPFPESIVGDERCENAIAYEDSRGTRRVLRASLSYCSLSGVTSGHSVLDAFYLKIPACHTHFIHFFIILDVL